MTETEELLVILMEECGELIQAAAKLLRVGVDTEDSDKHEDLTSEVADVQSMISLLVQYDIVKIEDIHTGIETKMQKLKKWSNLTKVN